MSDSVAFHRVTQKERRDSHGTPVFCFCTESCCRATRGARGKPCARDVKHRLFSHLLDAIEKLSESMGIKGDRKESIL